MSNKKIKYVWLSKLDISNKQKMKAIKILGGINEFYHASLDDLVYIGFNDNVIMKVLNVSIKEQAKKEYEYMYKNNIDIIGIEDSIYPSKLRLIEEMPICLYTRGDISVLNDVSIGIVGSRNAEIESLKFARIVASYMSNNYINVVSGLALRNR